MLVLTLKGDLKSGEQDAQLAGGLEEELYESKFKMIISHPEAWLTPTGQRILLNMRRLKMIGLIVKDEFHKTLPNHWELIRKEMAVVARRLRAFLIKGGVTVCLSATVKDEEIKMFGEMIGLRGEPVVIAASPVQAHFKIVVVKSPTCFVDPEGYVDAKGQYHPGHITLQRRIFLDELVTMVKQDRWSEIKQAIIFFRTDSQLVK